MHIQQQFSRTPNLHNVVVSKLLIDQQFITSYSLKFSYQLTTSLVTSFIVYIWEKFI